VVVHPLITGQRPSSRNMTAASGSSDKARAAEAVSSAEYQSTIRP
jgi:hypothetical protein